MVCVVFGLVGLTYVPMLSIYGDGGALGACVLLAFHALLGLMMASYAQVVLTDPGTVPESWQRDAAALSRSVYPQCRRSGLYKPPRSHYCSVTQRLVLNMDHFCPWTNNCIGQCALADSRHVRRPFFLRATSDP